MVYTRVQPCDSVDNTQINTGVGVLRTLKQHCDMHAIYIFFNLEKIDDFSNFGQNHHFCKNMKCHHVCQKENHKYLPKFEKSSFLQKFEN